MSEKNIVLQSWIITIAVLLLVALDQALKLYIRTHYMLGEVHEILPFFQICFVENNGMAFGIQWLPKWCLTAFRIIMVVHQHATQARRSHLVLDDDYAYYCRCYRKYH